VTDRKPDVEMRAAVRAEKLWFECVPDVEVKAHADSPAYAESGSDRENLPDEVEPGVTYRDVRVRWRAAARLRDPDIEDADPEGRDR
jgi:hypothetical protein